MGGGCIETKKLRLLFIMGNDTQKKVNLLCLVKGWMFVK